MGEKVAASRKKQKFWNLQRMLALFLMITAIVEITGSFGEASWAIQVTHLIQVRHPYFSDTVRVVAAVVSIAWWVIVLLISVYLFVDKNFWENKIFENRRM